MAMHYVGLKYWWARNLTPLAVGILGMGLERLMLRRLYGLDPLYGLLLTFGVALVLEGVFQNAFGISGNSYPVPELLKGGTNLGFMYLPRYRVRVVVISVSFCFTSWFVTERTRLGSYLRAI